MTNLIVFRPRSALILAAAAGAMILLFLIQVIFYSDRIEFSSIAFGILLATTVWLLLVRPKLEVFDEGIKIVNPLITAIVPLREIDMVDTRFALTVFTRGKKISVFVAPAPGRWHARSVRAGELKGLELNAGDVISPGDSPRSHSGQAAQIIKLRIKSVGTEVGDLRASARFNYAAAGVLVASIALFLILSVLHV